MPSLGRREEKSARTWLISMLVITLRQVLSSLDFGDGQRTYRLAPGVMLTTMLSITNASAAPGLAGSRSVASHGQRGRAPWRTDDASQASRLGPRKIPQRATHLLCGAVNRARPNFVAPLTRASNRFND